MKIRFIEFEGDIYVVVGITYDTNSIYPECFTAVPLSSYNYSIFKAMLQIDTINIPIDEAIEITDKNQILTLLVLYG